MKENNKSKKIIVSLALILSFSAFDKAVAQEWQPNSIEKIEASIREDNKKVQRKRIRHKMGRLSIWNIPSNKGRHRYPCTNQLYSKQEPNNSRK